MKKKKCSSLDPVYNFSTDDVELKLSDELVVSADGKLKLRLDPGVVTDLETGEIQPVVSLLGKKKTKKRK